MLKVAGQVAGVCMAGMAGPPGTAQKMGGSASRAGDWTRNVISLQSHLNSCINILNMGSLTGFVE